MGDDPMSRRAVPPIYRSCRVRGGHLSAVFAIAAQREDSRNESPLSKREFLFSTLILSGPYHPRVVMFDVEFEPTLLPRRGRTSPSRPCNLTAFICWREPL